MVPEVKVLAIDFPGTDDKIVSGTTKSYFNFMHNTSALFTLNVWVIQDVPENNDISGIGIDNRLSSGSIGVGIFAEDRAAFGFSRNLRINIVKASAGNFVLDHVSANNFYPNNTDWHLVTYTLDISLANNNSNIQVDAGSKDTASKTANGPVDTDSTDSFTAGLNSNGTSVDWNGKMALYDITNSVLPDSNISAIARGANPFVFDHANKKVHYPYHGLNSAAQNYVSNLHNGVETGVAKFADNPPVEPLENYLGS